MGTQGVRKRGRGETHADEEASRVSFWEAEYTKSEQSLIPSEVERDTRAAIKLPSGARRERTAANGHRMG